MRDGKTREAFMVGEGFLVDGALGQCYITKGANFSAALSASGVDQPACWHCGGGDAAYIHKPRQLQSPASRRRCSFLDLPLHLAERGVLTD